MEYFVNSAIVFDGNANSSEKKSDNNIDSKKG